jgi:hypothetical protein
VRATIKYTVIRVVVFAVILATLLIIAVPWYFATPIAALAGFAISYIFFRSTRDQVALELAHRGRRNARDEVVTQDGDTDAEDAALDRSDSDNSA